LKQQALLDSTHVDTLIHRYKCETSTCSNNGGFCYLADGKIHLTIFTQQLKAWSIAINDGDATLECPTEAFLKALMPAKAGTRNPFKIYDIPKPTPKPPSIDASEATPTPSYPPYPMPPYPYHLPYPSYGLPLPYPEHRTPQHRANRYEDDDREEHHDLRSSPSMDRDPVERMIKYFNWLAKMSPTQAKSIQEAKEILVVKGYSFRTLSQISNASFAAMDIEDGLALLIKIELSVFKSAEAKGKI
jgi:hypothetical protein